MNKWQQIETAPLGTMCLFCDMKATEVPKWAFVDWFGGARDRLMLQPKRNPTHWMPLPEPPE